MAVKHSAGLLLYRETTDKVVEVLIVHPGGPFWAKKDDGAWSIPKGEYEEGETPEEVARREFHEELGLSVPNGPLTDLGAEKQPSGKIITAYALEADLNLAGFRSNDFEMEWPRKSGRMSTFPEVDKAQWMRIAEARVKLLKGQVVFLDRLVEQLGMTGRVVNEGAVAAPADAPSQQGLF